MPGIPVARVVAVIVETTSGRKQVGSGFLLDAARVLTAWHCAIDNETGRAPVSLKVVRAIDGAAAAAVVEEAAPDLDVALLAVTGDLPWAAELPEGPVPFGRVDRERSGELYGCEAEGFPRWQVSGVGGFRDIAEVHGLIRATEGRERQRLVLRDPVLGGITVPDGGLAWAGFSGAAVFHGGLLIGVVIEQQIRQGDTTLQIRPVEAIAKADDDAALRLANALGISRNEALRPVVVGTGRWWVETAGESALAQWGWSLAGDEEGVRHWRPRARGVSIDSERGWRFRGRTAALTRIVSWLDRPRSDGKVLVVTGSPGAGKSAVLGRVVTTADSAVRTAIPPEDEGVKASVGSVHCAIHAKGKTALDVAREVARAASVTEPAEPRDLAPAVRDALDARENRFNVVIDALDEALSPVQVREIITEVIRPLAETCSNAGVQVLVGTRRRDDGGDILDRFPTLDLLDLDDPAYFAGEDLTAYALACLQLLGDERDGNPYADDQAAAALATRIAQVSGQNFLIAGLIARSHGLRDEVAADPGQLETPETVRSALDGYLDRLPGVGGLPARRLLTALAFAEEPGLTPELWKLAIETLPPRSLDEDWPVQVHAKLLGAFARSSAANFLVETRVGPGPSGSDGRSYQLFHRALSEALLAGREEEEIVDRAEDEGELTRAFIELGRVSGWEQAPVYLWRSLAAHAARAGKIDDLLADDEFLLHADLRCLLQAADDALTPGGYDRVRLLRLTPQALDAFPDVRAAMFSVTEALENLGNSYRNDHWQAPYRALCAATAPRAEHAVCIGHQQEVRGVCAVEVDGRNLLATVDHLTLRLWDPATGEQVRALAVSGALVRGVCVIEVDGRNLLATGHYAGVGLWSPVTEEQIRALDGHEDAVRAVCVVEVGGKELLATGSADWTVRVWDPATGEQVSILEGHLGEVCAVCAVEVDGQELLATSSEDHTVRLWDPRSGEHFGRLKGQDLNVTWALCVVEVDGRNLLVTGSGDWSVRLWDPAARKQVRVLEGHQAPVHAVGVVEVDGRNLLATGSDDGMVQLWDPATGEQISVQKGHQAPISAVCAVEVDGRNMLATGSHDGTIRIWDSSYVEQDGTHGHEGKVWAVCVVEVDGQELLASGSADRSVRLWDPATGEQVRMLKGHRDEVRAVCAVEVDGRNLLAAGSGDWSVRLWDPVTGQQIRMLEGHQRWVRAMCAVEMGGQKLLATGSDDRTVRLWDPRSGEQIRMLEGHESQVRAMCVVEVDGRNLLASGSNDGTIRLWDPDAGKQTKVLEVSKFFGVRAVCVVKLDGLKLLAVSTVSVRDSGFVVELWNLATGEQVKVLKGHENHVNAVCVIEAGGRNLLATASEDRTVRLWEPRTGICVTTVPTQHQALGITAMSGSLAIGLDSGILVVEPDITNQSAD